MKSERQKVALVVTGLPGSGKSEVVNFFQHSSFPVVRFGDITKDSLVAAGLSLTEKNERAFREELRQKLGMAAYAIKIYPRVKKLLETYDLVVLEGVISWEEYEYLRKRIDRLVLLAILASPSTRQARLLNRPERGLTVSQAQKRDLSELSSLHICPTLLLADWFIVNEGSLAKLYQQLKGLLSKIHDGAKN